MIDEICDQFTVQTVQATMLVIISLSISIIGSGGLRVENSFLTIRYFEDQFTE